MKFKVVWCFIFLLVALPGRAQIVDGADARPVAADQLLAVQPFVLKQSYTFDWSAEERDIRSGTLIVIKVDPKLVQPRNTPEPILYAGDRTVQRLNRGAGTGVVIGIIPGAVDLSTTPIWFGAPGLPESVTDETIRKERALAERARIQPFSAAAVARARLQPVTADDLADLLRARVAELVIEYVPEERDLAESWRLPGISAPRKERR